MEQLRQYNIIASLVKWGFLLIGICIMLYAVFMAPATNSIIKCPQCARLGEISAYYLATSNCVDDKCVQIYQCSRGHSFMETHRRVSP